MPNTKDTDVVIVRDPIPITDMVSNLYQLFIQKQQNEVFHAFLSCKQMVKRQVFQERLWNVNLNTNDTKG